MIFCSAVLFPFTLPIAFSSAPPQHILTNPSPSHEYTIPTIHESAVLARRILNLSSIGTLSTVFPSRNPKALHPPEQDALSQQHNYPTDINGAPIGLMDYYASCHPEPHNPTILAISIATTFRNTRAGSNVTLSLRWHPPPTAPPSDDIYTYSPANMPRFSLIGHIEAIPKFEVLMGRVEECFLDKHPDAEAWLPGNEIHESWWGKLVVEDIYWIGGFGDRAHIGWIPKDEWESVRDEEVRGARLVGEEEYNMWRSKQLGYELGDKL